MIQTTFFVALGGALGATVRFLIGVGLLRAVGPGFPVAIIAVNILGSFLMGLFVVLSAHKGWSSYAPFVMIGLLGGFTTFSAFSLETITLYERGALGQAALYVGLSVIGSLFAIMAGITLGRSLV